MVAVIGRLVHSGGETKTLQDRIGLFIKVISAIIKRDGYTARRQVLRIHVLQRIPQRQYVIATFL